MANIKANNILEYALAFIFILPYAETSIITDTFRYTTNDTYWRAILSIELILFVILIPITLHNVRCKRTILSNMRVAFIPFAVTMLFVLLYSFFLNGVSLPSLNLFLMIVTPMLNAYLINKFIAYKRLSIIRIMRRSVFFFVLFLIFAILFNIAKYGFSISLTDASTRLTASAGGPVILGYTIAFILAFFVAHIEIYKLNEILIISPILLFALILTQSRGALLVTILCLLFFIRNYSKIVVIFFLLISFFLLPSIIGILAESSFFKRFVGFDFFSDDRIGTFFSAIATYFSEIEYVLLGHGFDGFFPYQQWLLNHTGEEVYSNPDFNIILYNGRYMLVQPHNTFIYFIMETGLVGLLSFCTIFRKIYNRVEYHKKPSMILLICSFICISMLESTILLEPGIACTLWLVFFYSFFYSHETYY